MNRDEMFQIANALVETNRRNKEKKQLVIDEVYELRKLVLFDCKKGYFMCLLKNKKATAEGKLVTLLDTQSKQTLNQYYVKSHLDAQHEALRWCTNQD